MKKTIVSMALTIMLIAASSAIAALDVFKGQKGNLDIAGGTAHIPVRNSAKRIMSVNRHPHNRAGGGSGVGVNIGEGLVTIETQDAPQMMRYQYGLVFAFAIDGGSGSKSGKISMLYDPAGIDIYAGKIKDWKESRRTRMINVFGREDGSGTRKFSQRKR